MAFQIQNDDAPVYDDVFIMLGAFHIELSMFKALGKIIEGSGAPDILVECELLAGGSLNGFLGGTHYNRCKRLHEYLATSLRVLHYQRFLNSQSNKTIENEMDTDHIVAILHKMGSLNPTKGFEIPIDPVIQNHIEEYKSFESSSASGAHGATAQFWMRYIRLYDLYHNLTRSTRMGLTGLFLESLISITDLFFAVNHHNSLVG